MRRKGIEFVEIKRKGDALNLVFLHVRKELDFRDTQVVVARLPVAFLNVGGDEKRVADGEISGKNPLPLYNLPVVFAKHQGLTGF